MKTVGIIGGLGPQTTADFFLEVISLCFKQNKINRPPMLIFNVPMIFDLEKRIVSGGNTEGFLKLLIDSALKLEKGGSDFIVIPCNSAHVFIEEVRNAVKIPVLSIVEEAVNFLSNKKVHKVGLLATGSTLNNNLFDAELRKNRILFETPNKLSQRKIEKIIDRLLAESELGNEKEELLEITKEISVECILLACTDLQQVLPNSSDLKIFDTMKILANAAIREILKGDKE